MAMTLRQRMSDLKQALQSEENFSVISEKFFDMTDMDEFVYLCKSKKNELLEVILEQVLQKIFGEPRDFTLRMKYVKKFGFYHGSFLADSLPVGTFMYFEGIQMGMVAIATNFTGDVSYARFTDEIVMDGSFTGKKHSLETQ